MFAASFKHLGLTTHASALSTWQSITPVRGRRDDNERPLYRRSDQTKTIRQLPNGSIALRYHSTDVLVFNTDDTVDLQPYASRSTCAFVWAALGGQGDHVQAMWQDRDYRCPDHITRVGDKYYHTPDFVTVRYAPSEGGWTLVAGNRPIDVPTLDRSKTRAVLRDSGFKTFELWLKTQLKLGVDPRQGGRWLAGGNHTSNDVLRCLDEPDRYGDIARGMSAYRHVNDQLAEMRLALYKFHGLTDTIEVPYFNNWGEMNAAFARMRKYG